VTVPVSVREPGGPRPAVHEVVQHPQRRHSKLRTLERDPELDVRERVRDLTEALVLS
jgi:hypothetical protein